MNYLRIIENWSNDKWRSFGLRFLTEVGWERDWNSDMDVMHVSGKRFLVSFQHNLNRKAVGTEMEKNIISRIRDAEAEGFIGFYSGEYSTSLYARLNSFKRDFLLIGGNEISVLLPYFYSHFIDEFFANPKKPFIYDFQLNKQPPHRPLNCICGCGADILESASNILRSEAFIYIDSGKVFLLYGLKDCLMPYAPLEQIGWVEINQLLHPDQLAIWNGKLRRHIENNQNLKLDNYYENKRSLYFGIFQKMRSVDSGFFLFPEEF